MSIDEKMTEQIEKTGQSIEDEIESMFNGYSHGTDEDEIEEELGVHIRSETSAKGPLEQI